MASNHSGSNQNRQRIERLQNRLSSLQTNMEVTKTNKSAQATAMVNNLRDRFATQQNQTSDKFDTICSLLDQVGKQIEQQKRQNEQMIEMKAA